MAVGSLAERSGLSVALGGALLLVGSTGAFALDINVVYHLTGAQADADVYDIGQGGGGPALSLGALDFVADPDKGLRFGWNGGLDKWVLDGRIVTVGTAGESDPGARQAFDITMYFDPLAQDDPQSSVLLGMRELYDCAYTDGGNGGGQHCQVQGNLNVVDTDLWKYFEFDVNSGGANLIGVAGSQYDGVQLALSNTPDDGEYPFQIGGGASGRNTDNGASMWFHYSVLLDPEKKFAQDFENWIGGLNVNYTTSERIPEPAPFGMLAIGMLGLTYLRRRRRNRA